MIILLLLSSGMAFAQEPAASQKGCIILDINRPAQFISYEKKIEQGSKVQLRLRNNTNCTIIVETDDTSSTRLNLASNRRKRDESSSSPRDGDSLLLHYLVQDRRRWRAPEPAYGWGDSVYTYEIPAGQSVVFNVPSIHFKKQLDIVVPFNYAWENSRSIGMGVGGVTHRVYFLRDDLPKVKD